MDDIEAFAKVKAVPQAQTALLLQEILEERIKRFLMRVIGEPYGFKDWGGEKNDLYTDKLRFRRARRRAAIAIKGKGTKGPLRLRRWGRTAIRSGGCSTVRPRYSWSSTTAK